MLRLVKLALIVLLLPILARAEQQLTIAVASNFRVASEEIAAAFSKDTSIKVRLSSGSTGKLYAQIKSGAPFDVFLAADKERPKLLDNEGYAVPGSRISYALGSLVLLSTDANLSSGDCHKSLKSRSFRRLAIANPKTAPYGRAAQEFLRGERLWSGVSEQLVFGENIAQTLQFVATGNATLGFVAASQLRAGFVDTVSCLWSVPPNSHAPIVQQGVIVAASENKAISQQFVKFLRGPVAAAILVEHGYGIPE